MKRRIPRALLRDTVTIFKPATLRARVAGSSVQWNVLASNLRASAHDVGGAEHQWVMELGEHITHIVWIDGLSEKVSGDCEMDWTDVTGTKHRLRVNDALQRGDRLTQVLATELFSQ